MYSVGVAALDFSPASQAIRHEEAVEVLDRHHDEVLATLPFDGAGQPELAHARVVDASPPRRSSRWHSSRWRSSRRWRRCLGLAALCEQFTSRSGLELPHCRTSCEHAWRTPSWCGAGREKRSTEGAHLRARDEHGCERTVLSLVDASWGALTRLTVRKPCASAVLPAIAGWALCHNGSIEVCPADGHDPLQPGAHLAELLVAGTAQRAFSTWMRAVSARGGELRVEDIMTR